VDLVHLTLNDLHYYHYGPSGPPHYLSSYLMKQQADKHRSERSFEVGDWVFLRLQPYKQMSLKQAKKDNKL
jgi:hypothetical protein